MFKYLYWQLPVVYDYVIQCVIIRKKKPIYHCISDNPINLNFISSVITSDAVLRLTRSLGERDRKISLL